MRAPFAAFRWLQAGSYRATSPVIPPSAAWGLVFNLAGIDTRDPLPHATTRIRSDAPCLRLAVGMVQEPEVSVLYQQLHSYPVGNSSKELAPGCRGAKYHVAPVKREILVGFDCVVGVGCEDGTLQDRVRRGLSEGHPNQYGLPFAGDNNLLIDRIDCLDIPVPARWYVPVVGACGDTRGSCRLTVAIDRADSSRTNTVLFAPTGILETTPKDAWVRVGPLTTS